MPRWLIVGVAALTTFVLYAFLTHGTFSPTYDQYQASFGDEFFLAQARAMVHGHLWVDPAQIPFECWTHAGQCYGYFGLTPSLARMPALPLLVKDNASCAALFMTIALSMAALFALLIAGRLFASVSRTKFSMLLMAGVALSVGPASVLFATARPAVYEEAIAWSVGFAMVSLYCFLRWWDGEGGWWAFAATLALILSASARPTTVALGALLGLGALVRGVRGGRRDLRVRKIAFAVAIGLLPLLVCVGVYYLKFHTFVPNSLLNQQIGGPNAEPYWVAIRKLNDDHLQGLKFLPTALVAFLRPDGVNFIPDFPYAAFDFGANAGTKFLFIQPGSFYVEPFSTLPDDMPFAVLAMIAALAYVAWWRWRPIGLRATLGELVSSPLTYCVLGGMGSVAIMLTQGVITNRYLSDFYPFVVMGLLASARVLVPAATRLGRVGQITVGVAVVALVLWGVAINLGLLYGAWWHTIGPTPG